MKKQKLKINYRNGFTYIRVYQDNMVDINAIRYALGLRNFAQVVDYLIKEQVKRNNNLNKQEVNNNGHK